MPIDIGLEARAKLLAGAKMLVKTVAVTYGPLGRTTLLDRMAGLLATKDGVTVAREIVLPDPAMNLGAQTVKQSCLLVNEQVGDGTTTAAIIAGSLLEQGHKLVAAGHDPMQIVRGIRGAASQAAAIIGDLAVPIESQKELEWVALVASNGDEEVAHNLAEACMAVGKDGTISIEDGHSVGIELEFKDGMEIDKGVVSPGFLRGQEDGRVIEGPLVAVIGSPLREVEDVQHVLEESSQWPQNDLILFAESVEGQALTTMLVNDAKEVVKCVACNAPGFGDKKKGYLRDIAALAGATFVDPAAGMSVNKAFDSEWFGSLRKVTVRRRGAVLVAYTEAQDTIKERITGLRRELAETGSEYDQDRLTERIAKLAGGLCIMRIGGFSEAALKERRARVEDALGSVQSALEHGVVPGGAVAYLTIAEDIVYGECLTDVGRKAGYDILCEALRAPLIQLADNAGLEGRVVERQVASAREGDEYGWIGLDLQQGKIRDLAEDPSVFDPAPVVLSVIDAAVSAATTLLTVEVSITRKQHA